VPKPGHKTITVKEQTYEILDKIRYEHRLRSLDQAIQLVLKQLGYLEGASSEGGPVSVKDGAEA